MTAIKTALVTGGNKGIGREIARQLAGLGFTVWIGCRDAGRGQAAAAELSAEGDVRFIALDLADEDSPKAAAQALAAVTDHLDVLVNNAGVSLPGDGRASQLDVATLKATFETNVFGTFRVTQAFLPLIRAAPAGRIIMISSGLASLTRHADPGDTLASFPSLAYAASKSAQNAVMMGFANELRDTKVRVNAVNPGFVATDINGHRGVLTVAQGAAKAVELATMGEDAPTAAFLNDAGVEPW